MKILFLSGLYPPKTKGGGELSTHYIATGLVARGHDVTVVTQGEQRETTNYEGVAVERMALPFTAKPLFERRHMKWLAARFTEQITLTDFEVVHAHDFRMAQMLSELDHPGKIVTARDYAQICGSPNNLMADGSTCSDTSLASTLRNQAVVEAPWWRKPFRIWQYRYNIAYRLSSFQTFSHQVFISHAQRKEIERVQDLSTTTVHVIYNPVPEDYVTTSPAAPQGREILFVGTVQAYKGVGLLLEAFKKLTLNDLDVHLTIVGAGAAQREYEKLVQRWGLNYRVRFVGRVAPERLRSHYDAALVVVAPHLWVEPFGRVVVEAMARAKAVVTADVGGPAEIIQSGETGWLFERGSVDSLVQQLQSVLSMGELDRRTVQDAARKWVLDNLKIDNIAAQHEQVYHEMLKK